MAEAILKEKFGDRFEVVSAGTKPTRVNPFTIEVLHEINIDISKAQSKHTNEFIGQEFDLVVTVCDSAKENCPFFPGAKQYDHRNFVDPSQSEGSVEEILIAFRKSRDDIMKFIIEEFGPLDDSQEK
jgi:arsenate reductase